VFNIFLSLKKVAEEKAEKTNTEQIEKDNLV